jgi:TrmH family RNA methyltransferase
MRTEERITSRQNPLIQHVRKLLTSRSYRRKNGEYAADGVKLLEEAIRWKADLHTVLLADEVETPELPESVRLVRVPKELMAWLSPMETPQGALFVCGLPTAIEAGQVVPGCLLLDGLQDPGNVGTILRTADALEVPVLLTDDCADPYSHKTVRASMGAVFRTRPQLISREMAIAQCREAHIPLAVTALAEDTEDIRTAALGQWVTAIGSEGRGVSRELLEAADRKLIIPMNPRCESLNAAAAATIVLWQMRLDRP